MPIVILNKRARVPVDGVVVDTTSKSAEEWSRGLSPFNIGPVPIAGTDFAAANMENAWQYAKVYAAYADADGAPNDRYWRWALDGWRAGPKRYPRGRGAVPLYSLWRGQRLGYIDARRQIYAPCYAAAVEQTQAFARLREIYAECTRAGQILYLRDYDGYRTTQTYEEIMANPAKKMGHAFVLAMMLEGRRVWE
jgi:hypothetical protein